ncbi:MAG TPA: glycosyltransferase family protein [Planctomycetaceae bacterium]|nr:glycosyltransferase family protein [Planctomycetaceae bacterium]
MARIFYSMAGEGRGHAARVRTLVEHLRHDHELVLFAPDDAYEFLSRCYPSDLPDPNVRLLRIPGLRFHYTGRKLDLMKSIGSGLYYAGREMPRLVRALRRRMQAERPDLVISDFEPALPRAARREGVPVLSIDHQHVLLAYDLSNLPSELQGYAWLMCFAIRWHVSGATEAVASSFYSPPLKPGWEHVRQVGPLIRPEVASARPTTGDYVLSYLRVNTPDHILTMLADLGLPIKIYGLGERPAQGSLSFLPIHETQFVTDLAGCRAVVCAAGNQLLGESLYLGKPVLALPETQHHEQRINAFFLQQMGVGRATELETLDAGLLQRFLSELPAYRARFDDLRGQFDGTADALAAIHEALDHALARRETSVTASSER